MEQTQATQNAEFIKRRTQKNRVVMALIFGFVAVVWGVTMLKFDPVSFRNLARPAANEAATESTPSSAPQFMQEESQLAPKEADHAQ